MFEFEKCGNCDKEYIGRRYEVEYLTYPYRKEDWGNWHFCSECFDGIDPKRIRKYKIWLILSNE